MDRSGIDKINYLTKLILD